MRGLAAGRALAVACAAAALLVFWVGSASAQGQFHGIAFTKGCAEPTSIGSPLNCAYQILNVVDEGQDTVMVSGLTDVVHAAGGNMSSGNILGALQLVFSSPSVTCVGGSGAGTGPSPYVGATSCTLPFGTSITTNDHSFYTVQAGDIALGTLTDVAILDWQNTCTAPGVQNCSTVPQQASAGSSTTVARASSQTTTRLNGLQIPFLEVVAPVTVFDVALVTGVAGAPAPTGQVVFEFFNNGECTGLPLDSVGPIHGPPWMSTTRTITTGGQYSYQALYAGDVNYLASQSACEHIVALDANIQVSPLSATNTVNAPHTLTFHVNINDGSGYRNAPDGTLVNVSLTNAGGANAGFGSAGGPTTTTCTTGSAPSAAGSGDCQVTIVSSTAGTTTVHGSTDVNAAGEPFDTFIAHRETGDSNVGDSPDATKHWLTPSFTGIAFTKGCANSVQVGQPYSCAYSVVNNVNTDPDTVTISGIGDVVHAFAGDVTSGNILAALQLVFSDPSVTCVGGAGSGTTASPYVGATMCTLPFHTSITSNLHAFYTVQPSDFNLAGHMLTDTATLGWKNLCDGAPPGGGCSTGDQTASAGASAVVAIPPPAQLTLQVVDAGNVPIIQAIAPATVHAVATVSGSPGGPAPTGQVSFDLFPNANCAGGALIESPPSGPPFSSVPSTLGAGLYSYVAHYLADPNYAPSDSSCRPFRVLDANLQISPLTATNVVGANHTLTAHVNANDGTGFLPAPGTTVTFSLTGPGAFVPAGANSCTTDASGNCTVVFSSATTGTTTIHASADVQVGGLFGGLVVHRATGDSNAGDSPDATKRWILPVAVVAQVQATCNDVLNGTAATLAEVDYSVSRGTIAQQINPGTFLYYAKITTTTPNQVVTVSQSNSSTNGAALFELNGQPLLWSGDCSSKSNGTATGGGSGASFTAPLPGDYVIAVKYRTKPLAKTAPPVPAVVTYSFTTSLGGNTGASVLLKPQ